MDNLFKIRTLTTSINAIKSPSAVFYNKFFKGKGRMETTDRLAFDVISGSEKILPNISIYAPATVRDKTTRKTITMQAPRIAEKRHIPVAALNAVRAFGSQMAPEMMRERIATEQMDLMNEIYRTWEFQAVHAMKGKIYDSDGKTLLVDYNIPSTHKLTLSGNDLFTDTTNCKPTDLFTDWQQIIEDDASAPISNYIAYMGKSAYQNLMKNGQIQTLLSDPNNNKIIVNGVLSKVLNTELVKYTGYYKTDAGTTTRYIGDNELILVGMTPDITDCPYAPVMDSRAPNGVGNILTGGKKVPVFSKSWEEEDPSGRWIKAEARILPVLKRPENVMIIQTAG